MLTERDYERQIERNREDEYLLSNWPLIFPLAIIGGLAIIAIIIFIC